MLRSWPHDPRIARSAAQTHDGHTTSAPDQFEALMPDIDDQPLAGFAYCSTKCLIGCYVEVLPLGRCP